MRRRDADEYEDDEEGGDESVDEGEVDPSDVERFSKDVVECPFCGEEIFAEAGRCPHCREILTGDEHTGSHRKPLWFLVTGWVLVWMFGGGVVLMLLAWLLMWWMG